MIWSSVKYSSLKGQTPSAPLFKDDWIASLNFDGDSAPKNNNTSEKDTLNISLIIEDVSVNIIEQNIPLVFSLDQNYPNPFNPITRIDYELPKTELVSLKIFDIMGLEVVSLVNEIQKLGQRFALWDATNNLGQSVSAGMYIYTIQAGEFIKTKKMVLLK